MGLDIAAKFILSFVLGTIIGLEREIDAKRIIDPKERATAILGVRSFSLITILGSFLGVLYTQYPPFALLLSANFALLSLIFYGVETFRGRRIGITTELAMIFAFLIGVSIALDILPLQLVVALTIVLTLILSRKEDIKGFAQDIRKREVDAFISFAIIAIVILPFLPNKGLTIVDFPILKSFIGSFPDTYKKIHDIQLINPFSLWMIVALMTGVNLFGYVLEKMLGAKKGWLLTSFIGGFISSTATTQSLAHESKKHKKVNYLVGAALLAYLGNFVAFPLLVAPINKEYLLKLLPVFAIIVATGISIVLFILRRKEKVGNVVSLETVKEEGKIFNVIPALKFAGLFLGIQLISKIAYEFFGANGFIFTSALASLTGVHAVLMNTAVMAGQTIDFRVATWTFLLVNAINLGGKSAYSFLQGKKKFAVKYTISIGIIIATSLLSLFFI